MPETNKTPTKAVIFIDGSNFHHRLQEKLQLSTGALDYTRLSQKLVGNGKWLETRYYVGQVQQEGDLSLYRNQHAFLERLNALDRVSIHLGRMQRGPVTGTAKRLKRWLNALQKRGDIKVSAQAAGELAQIAGTFGVQWTEKAVDVMIATDMVSMAYEGKYDNAYLISSDGDYTPAVKKVRETGREVFVASPTRSWHLTGAASAFIPLRREFFDDCLVRERE